MCSLIQRIFVFMLVIGFLAGCSTTDATERTPAWPRELQYDADYQEVFV